MLSKENIKVSNQEGVEVSNQEDFEKSIWNKLKECKTFRELFEVIPDTIYEKTSLIIIVMMFFMIIRETATRFITRHQSLDSMVQYFYIIGYVSITFSIIFLISRLYKMSKKEIKNYFKEHIYEVFFLVILILSCISALFAQNKSIAFKGHWFRQNGIRSYFIYASMYICGKNVKKEKYKKILLWTSIITSTVQSTLIISKYFGGYGSRLGAFYNRNYCGYFLCMSIMAAAGLVIAEKKAILKIIAMVLYIVNVWCLIINDTFGSYLAICVGIAFLIIIEGIRKKRISIDTILLMLMFLVVSGYADYQTGILSSNFKITTSDVGKITKNDDDIAQVGTGRGELWMGAIECIKDNPILGCGPENISYYNEKLGEPHNEILMFGAEDGIIAMCMYIIGLISIFVTNIKRVRKIDRLKIAAGGVVCAYVVSSVFGVMVFYAAAFYYIFLGNIS